MPTDKPSEADRALVRRLRRAGLAEMTEARLQRWQKQGLMVRAEQVRVPGRRGSSSVYPEGSVEQALALGRILERHRSFDKATALLFAHGYPVELRALRGALEVGLDHLDRKVARYAGDAGDPSEVARRVGEGIVSEPLRTREERAYRRQQLAQVGGRERLVSVYTTLAGMYVGGSNSVGAFLASYRRLGHDLRTSLGLDPVAFAGVEMGIDSALTEVRGEGGLGHLLRSALAVMDLERFEALRSFSQEGFSWLATIGFTIELPSSFLADLYAALVNPDRAQLPASETPGQP